MPDWAKTGIIIGGILASNFITGGLQYGLKTAPAVQDARDADAIAVSSYKEWRGCAEDLAMCEEALRECRAGD